MNRKGTIPPLIDKDDWGHVYFHSENGFIVWEFPEKKWIAFTDDDETNDNHVSAMEKYSWYEIDRYNTNPSRHEKFRLAVHIETGDKYILQKGEKFKREYYNTVVKKEGK